MNHYTVDHVKQIAQYDISDFFDATYLFDL